MAVSQDVQRGKKQKMLEISQGILIEVTEYRLMLLDFTLGVVGVIRCNYFYLC